MKGEHAMIRKTLYAALLTSVWTAGAAAQQGSTSTTPQTARTTDKPQQVVISGCVGNASNPTGTNGATGQPMYSLNQLQYGSSGSVFDDWARMQARSSGTTGTTATTGTSGTMTRPAELMLGTAPKSTVDLSKYVGQNIQVTGTIGGPMSHGTTGTAGASGATGTTGTTGTSGTSGTTGTTGATGTTRGTGSTSAMHSQSPMLTVTSVKVLSTKCGGTF
jgi:hypothetical protein